MCNLMKPVSRSLNFMASLSKFVVGTTPRLVRWCAGTPDVVLVWRGHHSSEETGHGEYGRWRPPTPYPEDAEGTPRHQEPSARRRAEGGRTAAEGNVRNLRRGSGRA